MATIDKISYFNPPVAPIKGQDGQIVRYAELKPRRSLTLSQIHSLITEDQTLKELIEGLRSQETADLRREYKNSRLPFVTFSADFSDSKRSKSGVTNPTGYLCLDFDHIGSEAQVEDLKQKLSKDPQLGPVLLFRSPSGDGLKVVIELDQEIKGDPDIKRAFKAVDFYIKETYKLEIDPACKNIDRTCYLSYDPEAILTDGLTTFDIDLWESRIPAPVEVRPQPQTRPQTIDQRPLRETIGSGSSDDLDRAIRAVEDIESSGIDITSDYSVWLRIGYALSTLGEAGRDLYHRVSKYYPDYNYEDTDRQFTACLASDQRGGSGVRLESLFAIAREAGVDLRPDPEYISSLRSQKFDPATDFGGSEAYQGSQRVNPSDPTYNPAKSPENDLIGQTRQILRDIDSRLKRGNLTPSQVEDLLRDQIRQIQEVSPQSSPDWLLAPTTEDQITEEESKLPEGLITGYKIGDQTLEIGAGCLTGFVAPTNHGKTILLLNLILNCAKKYPDKKFILFTYEERSNRIIEYLLNIYLEDLRLSQTSTNRRVLKGYYKYNRSLTYFDPQVCQDFNDRKDLFYRTYIETGRILIKYVDSDSRTLCNQLRYLSEKGIGGVFVDYMQFIPKDPRSKAPTRQEELKQICISLKDTANETGLPIVLACQFNREVACMLDIHPTKVGEAGDIERILSEMYGLWQFGKKERQLSQAESNDPDYKYWRDKADQVSLSYHDKPIEQGGLLIEVLKSRDLPTGKKDLFTLYKDTGRLIPNDTEQTLISRPDWDFAQLL